MDNSQIPSFEIPKNTESPSVNVKGAELRSDSKEASHEILPPPAPSSGAPATPLGPIPTVVGSVPQTTQVATPVTATLADDSHIIADDVDVIEKEWVDRAKRIINLTSDDPYVEAKEISKLKATYLKKRFNKDLPISEDGVS